MESISRKPTTEAIFCTPTAGQAPTAKHTLMIADIAVLTIRAPISAIIGPILQKIIRTSITLARIALSLSATIAGGTTIRANSTGQVRNLSIVS